MLLLIAVLLFFLLVIVFSAIFLGIRNRWVPQKWLRDADNQRLQARDTLAEIKSHQGAHPTVEEAMSFGDYLSPRASLHFLDNKLMTAGGIYGLRAESFLALWVLFILLAISGGWVLAVFLGPSGSLGPVAIIVGGAVGVVVPLLIIVHRLSERKRAIRRALPSMLDMIYISVEAGLTFDGALAKIVEKMHGPLADEFARVLQEIWIGVPRRAALHNLASRCELPDVAVFTAAMIRADELGVSIAQTLRIQTEELRKRRQVRIREQAQKAPVKLAFPLVLFIFPALLIVLLGPAFISIVRTIGP
ncbi:MAG: type II secretion system F family protein [Negativicutes bacterium]|nr:type II secretion system F family protein [Negativicutes bacterium]